MKVSNHNKKRGELKMSSFNCLVIHREEQDIAELMAPYSEELVVKPYIRETKENCYKKWHELRKI